MCPYIIYVIADDEIFNHNSWRKQTWVYKGKEIEQRNSKGLILHSAKIII